MRQFKRFTSCSTSVANHLWCVNSKVGHVQLHHGCFSVTYHMYAAFEWERPAKSNETVAASHTTASLSHPHRGMPATRSMAAAVRVVPF